MGKLWKCPQCGAILQKGNPLVEDMIKRGVLVGGTATCANCNAQFSQRDVYSGKYDVYSGKYGINKLGIPSEGKKWWQFWK